jgi:hypothetical protein
VLVLQALGLGWLCSSLASAVAHEENGDAVWSSKGVTGATFYRVKLSCDVHGLCDRFYLQFTPYLKHFQLVSKKGGQSRSGMIQRQF